MKNFNKWNGVPKEKFLLFAYSSLKLIPFLLILALSISQICIAQSRSSNSKTNEAQFRTAKAISIAQEEQSFSLNPTANKRAEKQLANPENERSLPNNFLKIEKANSNSNLPANITTSNTFHAQSKEEKALESISDRILYLKSLSVEKYKIEIESLENRVVELVSLLEEQDCKKINK